MKILITGSEGFVGKNLISRLNKKKLDYISVSKKTGNILSQKLWNQLPKCNLVIHLASKANMDESWKSIFEYNKTNVLGTLRVLEYCRKHNSKLIFLSSK